MTYPYEVNSKNGFSRYDITGDTMAGRETKTNLTDAQGNLTQGKGEGYARFHQALTDAQDKGLNHFVSDKQVSQDATRLWAKAVREGYPVERNPDAIWQRGPDRGRGPTKDLVTPDGSPVFTLDLRKPVLPNKTFGPNDQPPFGPDNETYRQNQSDIWDDKMRNQMNMTWEDYQKYMAGKKGDFPYDRE
jgi:hypothetical protein